MTYNRSDATNSVSHGIYLIDFQNIIMFICRHLTMQLLFQD